MSEVKLLTRKVTEWGIWQQLGYSEAEPLRPIDKDLFTKRHAAGQNRTLA
jgi:hypothetical protein